MRARFFVFIVATALWLAACSSARQSRPLAYPGDGRGTVSSIAAAVKKRGYEPVVNDREFCKFKYKDRIWIHFKAKPKQVVLAVDVADAKQLPKSELDALFNEGMRLGEDIWKEASAEAAVAEARVRLHGSMHEPVQHGLPRQVHEGPSARRLGVQPGCSARQSMFAGPLTQRRAGASA